MSIAIAEPPPTVTKRSRPAVRPRSSSELLPQLLERHQAEVWRYLRTLGCEPDLADDLTQETFLVAFCRPFDYRGRAAAASYLRRTAYHRFVGFVQGRKRAVELGEAEVTQETWRRWHGNRRNDSEILEMMKECLAFLPERSRYALELRYREGCSRQEIAKRLSLSEHGAKNLIQRAKKRLRQAMECRMTSMNDGCQV